MPNNAVPYEVIAAPYTVWVAVVGTTKPAIDAVNPGIAWTKVGTSGNLNYDDGAGVEVEHSQAINLWRSLGDSGSRKAFRTSEDLKIRLMLADLTLEQYSFALNGNSVTTVPPTGGVVGYRWVGLSRGLGVDTRAVLVRGSASPYGSDFVSQYFIPIAAQTGNPTIKYVKSTPALIGLEWTALVDPSAATAEERFGVLEAQDLIS